MLKFCKSICKALYIIFKSCLTQDIFSSEWKAENALIHKKKKKNKVIKTFIKKMKRKKRKKKKKKKKKRQCVKDYIPVSLVPICSKVFESIILYNTMFPYITLNHLISENQSELKVGL